MQLPDGFASASYEKVPGWTVKVTLGKAPKPIEMEGEKVTEQVDQVTFTSTGKSSDIAPGQFQDFPLSVEDAGRQARVDADVQGAADLPRR